MYAISDIMASDIKPMGYSEILDLFEDKTIAEDFTYTMRLFVPKNERPAIMEKLVQMKETEPDVQRLIDFLKENDWDVSFLVDCF